jgi:hypothetical protein
MPILVALLLGIAALAFVLYPLYRRPARVPEARHPQGLSLHFIPYSGDKAENVVAPPVGARADVNVDDREQTARTALQEIELDYQLGNLAETDYRTLRERYMRRVLVAVRTRQKSERELDEAIEEQLRILREKESNETESE